GICSLEANHLYYQGPPNVDKLELITVGKSIYSSQEEAYIYAIFQNKIDVADISSTRALYDTIRLMNANGELNGDRILSSRYDTAAYSFIGINAEKINIAGLPDSESSKSLRKALAVLFAAYRDEVRAQQYGDSATVIDYPISYTFYAAPHKNDPDYHAAYSLNQVGGEIFTPGMTAEDRAAAALDAAKGYLRRAGYVFDEATGQATSPEGAPQRFEILICDDPSDPASTLFYVLDRVKSVMHSLGLVLDIRTVKTEIDLLVALNLGETSMWCSAWTDTDPAYYLQYHSSSRSEGGYNFTNINDLGLDLLLDELSRRPDSEVKAQLYRACMDHILDWAVMIPCFQRQNATLFNAVTVKADSVSPDTTPYWSWLQQAASLEIRR
ncbi:MAG: ABC transporter substrate-binding protein, partial [Firmicutes bacterium]|nr:ABC transporter substrate-binding protein [Bacillota bacterium]